MAVLIPGARAVFETGGFVFTDLNNLKVLHSVCSNTNNFCTFRAPNGTSGYQVTVGKSLRVWALELHSHGTTIQPYFAQTDNDVGWQSTTAFTNAVYICGATPSPWTIVSTSGTKVTTITKFDVAATKYFSTNANSGSAGFGCNAYAYEV